MIKLKNERNDLMKNKYYSKEYYKELSKIEGNFLDKKIDLETRNKEIENITINDKSLIDYNNFISLDENDYYKELIDKLLDINYDLKEISEDRYTRTKKRLKWIYWRLEKNDKKSSTSKMQRIFEEMLVDSFDYPSQFDFFGKSHRQVINETCDSYNVMYFLEELKWYNKRINLNRSINKINKDYMNKKISLKDKKYLETITYNEDVLDRRVDISIEYDYIHDLGLNEYQNGYWLQELFCYINMMYVLRKITLIEKCAIINKIGELCEKLEVSPSKKNYLFKMLGKDINDKKIDIRKISINNIIKRYDLSNVSDTIEYLFDEKIEKEARIRLVGDKNWRFYDGINNSVRIGYYRFLVTRFIDYKYRDFIYDSTTFMEIKIKIDRLINTFIRKPLDNYRENFKRLYEDIINERIDLLTITGDTLIEKYGYK